MFLTLDLVQFLMKQLLVGWLVDIFSVVVGIAKLCKNGTFYGDPLTREMLISYVYLI